MVLTSRALAVGKVRSSLSLFLHHGLTSLLTNRHSYAQVWPRYAALFVAIALYKVMTPTLSRLLRRWHFWLTAETPRLVFKRTPSNTDLLSRCVTMSEY